MSMERSYSELMLLPTFEERFRYLMLGGYVGVETFGSSRWINQAFYKSKEWTDFRRSIIVRDGGCDLAIPGFDIFKWATIHHINPLSKTDVLDHTELLFDPENVITVTPNTHKAIHYGDDSLLTLQLSDRKPNDTCPWKE